MGLIGKIAKYGVRAAKLLPEMVFGTSAEVFGKGVKEAAKGTSVWTKVKAGAKAVEKDVARQAAEGGGGFFKRTWKSLKTFPKDVVQEAKLGIKETRLLNKQIEEKMGKEIAKQVGKSTFKGAAKGVGKAIAKRMPLIGAVLTLIIDGPAIFKKFKNEGFAAGMKETAGVGVELGCMAAGAAIGSIFPGAGTVIGGIVGALVGCFIRGKISPEKPKKQGEVADFNIYKKECKELGLSDKEIEYAAEQGYSIDDIKQILEVEEKYANIEKQGNSTAKTTTKPTATQPKQSVIDPYGFSAILGILASSFPQMSGSSGTTGKYNPLASTTANPYLTGMNPFMQYPQYDSYLV